MTERLRSQFFTVVLDESQKLVRVIRSPVVFDTVPTVIKAWREVDTALPSSMRKGLSLMVDLRQAPSRNDPEFERAIRTVLPEIRKGFRMIGVLVRSAVGGLQVSRMGRADGVVELISSNEPEMLKYLQNG